MSGFERGLVKAFNRYFEESHTDGIAYRRKQHRFSSQFLDVLVDSEDPRFYMGLEGKSLKTKSANTLYFSQHFSEANDTHQVRRISDFLERSGRRGFLAVELRRGPGRPKRAFLIPWEVVDRKFETGAVGLPVEDIKGFPEIKRDGGQYGLSEVLE
ncbi:MAG: hypothetical protein SVV03_01975 [Candidatus Nanohaloarchaea archaeon]|nr:hypothetical protein [Candidatus Nanohaloarchaea archaeon]